MKRHADRAAALLATAAIVLAGRQARADGFGATIEPGYAHVETTRRDQAGATTREEEDALTQRYRLSLTRALTEGLALGAGVALLDERSWKRTDGVRSEEHDRVTSWYGRLTLGTPALSGGLGVDRREQEAPASPTFVTESYTGYASWRPLDLSEVDLRAGRLNAHDVARRQRDATTDSASASVRYRAPAYDLRYLLSWNRASDRLHATRTTAIEQTVLGTRTDTLLRGRTSTYLSATLQRRTASTETTGPGGTVTRQQLPVAGLSAIEAFPATAENVVLAPNPPLVDGNTAESASVNVGFGPSVIGDRDARAMGARFADTVTPVNTIHVWLGRPLTEEVGRALAATIQVHESDDNQRWSPVAVAAPPELSPFEPRIEITIARTEARLLKVSLRPLATGVTTDLAFRDLFVTEVQFLLVVPAELEPRRRTTTSASATAIARTVILRSPEVAHDASLAVSHQSDADRVLYAIVNGLSVAHELRKGLAGNARAARIDQDSGSGHEGLWQWSAALVGRPLPTVHWTVTYSGTTGLVDADGDGDRDERAWTNSLSALGRADWYDGISTQASGVASFATRGERTARTVQGSGSASLAPNRFVTLTAGALYSRSVSSEPGFFDLVTQYARVDGSVSFRPAPALSGSATLSRIVIGARPTTLGTFQLDYSPLRGELQLTVAYSKTLDTEADATTELLSPTLRWNVRRGVTLTAAYTHLESSAPAQVLTSRTLGASLLVTL